MTAPIIHRGIEQGTPEWFALRAGKFSASKAGVIMGGLETKGLADYMQDLAWERVYGPIEGGYKSAAMERGNILEQESREWYSFETGHAVDTVTLVQHGGLSNVVWSPDGLIGTEGALEAKNPLHRAWMDVKRTGKIPAEYRHQCRWAMWVGDLQWMDFVAHHPQAGGIIIGCEVTETEKEMMAERVALLEPKVQAWVEILKESK